MIGLHTLVRVQCCCGWLKDHTSLSLAGQDAGQQRLKVGLTHHQRRCGRAKEEGENRRPTEQRLYQVRPVPAAVKK